MVDLGALGGSESAAFGINECGQIVGRASASGSSRVFPLAGRPDDLPGAHRSLGAPPSPSTTGDRSWGGLTRRKMGANIYPEDVEAVLYRDPEVAPRLHSFLLSVVDDEAGTPRPEISLELTDLQGIDDAWRQARAESFASALAKLNMDFRSSVGEFPSAMRPLVRTYGRGEGPFLADAHRIKQRRIVTGPSGTELHQGR